MTPYWSDNHLTLYGGDCREVLSKLPAESVNTVVTSPPYWGLRDYGVGGQLGLEPTPDEYVANLVAVFREVRRVLRSDGTLWLNLGDSYAGSGKGAWATEEARDAARTRVKEVYVPTRAEAPLAGKTPEGLKPKDLVGIPWRVAFALQADGWYLRSDIIWAKPNPMPEPVTDRPTKAHEYVFLLSSSSRYFYDSDAVREEATKTGTLAHLAGGSGARAGNRDGLRAEAWIARKQAQYADARPDAGSRRMAGFNERWDEAEAAGVIASGRNLRTVWNVPTEPYPGAHFATFPRKLVEPCVKAGSPEGGVVLDPFAGSGTTLLVAQALGRRGVGIDLNPDYLAQAIQRNRQMPLGLGAA